jgi:hypothetical protein
MYGSSVGFGCDPEDTSQEKLEKRIDKLEREKQQRDNDDNFSMTGSYYHDDD